MYDMHYDLLTYILIKHDDEAFLRELCNQIYRNDNIVGGIINSYYTTPKEMAEVGLNPQNVVQDIKIVNDIIERNDLLPNPGNFIKAIEGCDLVSINQLEELYDLGIRVLLPVYSHDNKYGGGCKGTYKGLTSLGEDFVRKAINLGFAIDISHAGYETANDMLDIAKSMKNEGYKPIVMASHSNVYNLTPMARNLPDEIFLKLKELDGIVGILALKSFCYNGEDKTPDYAEYFIKHLQYIINLIGPEHVCIASDNMAYDPDKSYLADSLYDINTFADNVRDNLKKHDFSDEVIGKILYENFENKVLKKLKTII